MDPLKSGRVWAWFGFALGIVASISANITHSYIVQTSQHSPNIVGPLVSSAFWPLALFLCLEVMSRVVWPAGWIWWAVRYIGLSLVAGIAAIVSWRHMNGLLDSYGEDALVAIIGPISVDGLMCLCSSALLAIAHNRKRRSRPEAVESEVRTQDLAVPEPSQAPEPKPAVKPSPKPPGDLLEAARTADQLYRAEHDGRPITRDALRAALRVSGQRASEVLKQLKQEAAAAHA